MYRDDPYVLHHSIKALKNLAKDEEMKLGKEWLQKLHKFVTDPENASYFDEDKKTSTEQNEDTTEVEETSEYVSTRSQTIDVTSAYTSMIRQFAKLRGAKGAAAEARKLLNRMHRVHNLMSSETDDASEVSEEDNMNVKTNGGRGIASIEIRANAYNLVLGLYRDSKNPQHSTDAVELLQRMIDAGKGDDQGGAPLPTEQSFEFAIMSLANMSDGDRSIQEAERLVHSMNELDHLESSALAYNAYITVCNKQLFGKPELYNKVLGILDKMNEIHQAKPAASPNPETLALVMKACSLSENDDHEKVLASAASLFSQLEGKETSETSAEALTDRSYYYMMKCVDTHMVGDPSAKKDRIEELFSEACQRGLCSANVLSMFRNSVSEVDFGLTVGKGRLAPQWIANITGPRALYTDGSKGGAGKNARRKGKSTSDWVKKERTKEAHRVNRKKEKQVKKFFKKANSTNKKVKKKASS